jgi:PDZ domain-containing protein
VKRLAVAAVVLGALGLAATFVLWVLPADEFIFTPDQAKPLAERVQVEGARPAGTGDVYYVDVYVRRTSLLEDLLPFTRPEGATVVPKQALLPPGTSESERDRQTAAEMARSEKIASVVALRALGYDVVATPRGALVIGVAPDVPAAAAIDAGDVIVGVDGKTVRTPSELRAEIGRREPGDDVKLTIDRHGERIEPTVRTVPNPVDPSTPVVGIQVDQEAKIELPIDVDIDLGRVGGPSAGLPFALEIARMLGRDVTHGCKVAATGELALDGSVLTVGGLKQKTIGARRTGVDLFLVPVGENAQVAQDHAGGVRVIPVESFQQALRTLTTASVNC